MKQIKNINDASWIELDRSAIAHNAQQFRSILENNHIAFVIKGNGYGHGLIQTAQIADTINQIDWLCTFTLSEALLLRENNIEKPVLVLGHINADPTHAIHKNIHFVVDNLKDIAHLNSSALAHNTRFYIHLKVDVGLSRFGVFPKDIASTIHYIQQSPGVLLSGLCTHTTEKDDHISTRNVQQMKTFNTAIQLTQVQSLWIHATATVGSLLYSCVHYNLFRIGIGLYGYLPRHETYKACKKQYPSLSLRPALTWKSRIIRIKKLQKGEYVGYNCTYQTTRETIVGIIPVGYSNGYTRVSEKQTLFIGQQSVTIIGEISMNCIMIDLTDMPDATIGTKVTILGKKNLIDTIQTSPINIRHILTNIKENIPRYIV